MDMAGDRRSGLGKRLGRPRLKRRHPAGHRRARFCALSRERPMAGGNCAPVESRRFKEDRLDAA